VLDSTFEIVRRSAVTGFKNLEDLRTLIFRYGEFRTAEEVGLKLPRPVVETITIAMDEVQEAKYRHYVARIEEILSNPNPESSPGNVILGLLARLSLIALHGSLEDGYTYQTALEGGVTQRRMYNSDGEVVMVKTRLPRPVYSSPKLVECARRVAASPHCGHIIFCEPTAVHLWLIEVLVEHGIPRDRIAVMNAAETKSADRLRIAREFNGLSSEPPPPGTCGGPSNTTITPKTDVIIGNSVMNEGLDLQVRTCSIHHLDLPWTPADLEQRNGRAVRQGNTLGVVQIYYYFADGSTDGYRFSLIDGKAGWLGELIKSQVRDTNNPAAQQQLTPEDILLMISRDKDKTRAMLEDKRRRQAEEARKRIALEATRLFRQAAARFRAARVSDDAEAAARLREEGELRLADLERVDAEAWPWAPWMYAARDLEVLIPDTGAPVHEGLRIARPRAGSEQLDHLEFGRIIDTDQGVRIGLRAAGSPSWQLVNYTGLVNDAPLLPGHLPRTGGPAWPDDDEVATAAALDKKIPEVFRFGRYPMLRWRGATDAWLAKWWPRYEPMLRDGLVKDDRDVVPIEGEKGLALATGDEIRDGKILLPTHAGWQRFLELAPASGLKFTALKEIGLEWWDRRVPQNLLSGGKDEPPDDEPPQTKPPRGEPPQAKSEPNATIIRPRAGAEAAKTVARRLQKLLTGSVRIDRYRYGSADSEAVGDQVVVRFQSSDGPQLVLYVAPRQEREVDLRGELLDGDGGVIRRFDWIVIELAELIALKEVSFAQWFGVPVEPEQKLSVIMMEALAALHAEEDARPWEPHSWPGVHDSTKDALVARGLVVALDGKGGGFPRYRTTPAGRAVLLKRTAPPGAQSPTAAQEAAEEAHMGAALRAARDQEEAAWAEALRRGIAYEAAKNGLDHEAARKAAIRNLATDLNHYDPHQSDVPTPTAAEPSATVDQTMLLRIQREATPDHPALDVQERVSSLEEASREYRRAVEASGEGASTFPAGQVVLPNGPTYTISYNGRVWNGDQKLYDPMPTLRPADPANTYEVARSAIRALGLPPSKYASYLRQAEAAITDGKSYESVLKRARKAADKLGLNKRPEEGQAPPARAPQSSELATILDTFNDEPRFRLASQRQGAGTQTYIVFREGSSADDALAAIDVVNYDVDGVRWLDLRVPANDQDAILERMDRALWAAADAENADDNARSPLQDLSDMMERLVQARGVDLKASQSPKRADGYGAIAEALAELAEPAPTDAMQLEVWLESTGVFIKAAEVVAGARGDDIKVPDLMRRLWREVLLAVPITTISAGPSPVPADAAAASETLVVPDSALRRMRADGGVQATVLERRIREGRASLREVVVRVRGDATRPKWSIVSDATGRLQPGATLHDNTHPDEFLRLLYSNINAFEDHLAEAPKRLADVRTLLYWTAAMLDAPLCQGEVKRRATTALEQAQGYYDAARRQLIEGRTVDAARRIHEALRRISAAAAELAKSCGDGQTLLPGAAPVLEITPADRAALSLPATAAAPAARAATGLVRPAAMMALVKPTPEQLRERFATPSRTDDAKAMPIYYIFRSRSGLPELLTREEIEARARDAVGHEVYDEAKRNPMPGAELFESAIGAVELLLDAEFEGRADPRWASSILLNKQTTANTEQQA
jgi:predicted RNase H-like HicB family nuclease